MTIAELRGKISGSGQNLTDTSEDLLTSDVFGCLRYVSPECGLVQFLQTATTLSKSEFSTPRPIISAHWSFWPSIHFRDRLPCQPDVVIGLESQTGLHLVMIEAKYHSEKSSYENGGEHPNDQLARELHNLEALGSGDLGWKTTKEVVDRSLVYLTQDVSIPLTALQESLQEYRRKRNRAGTIYWTSWRYLEAILEEQSRCIDTYQATVLNDMRLLLEKKGLTMFHGMTLLTTSFDKGTYTFYSLSLARYDWPDILSALESMPIYSYTGGKNEEINKRISNQETI